MYNEVEACAGVSSIAYSDLKWYTTEAIHYTKDSEREWKSYGGIWIRPNEIIIHADRLYDVHLVKHEMLHAVLQGDTNHSGPYWSTCT